jgi:hypothetical protein
MADQSNRNPRGSAESSAEANNGASTFSALLAFAEVHELTVAELVGAIRHLHPKARVTGWGGSDQPAQGAKGILLSVNDVDMAVINQQFAAPPGAFDGGNQPDFYWQNAKEEIKRHKSHVFVIEAAAGDVSQGIGRAGAITIVVDAISSLKPLMGVKWESSKNLVRADHFAKLMQGFRTGALPVGLWVRLLAASLPPVTTGAARQIVAGTFGLQFFGSPNIEIHARRMNDPEILSTALSYAETRLTTGRPTWNEATTTIENVATFRIERLANGVFGIGPVAKLVDAP